MPEQLRDGATGYAEAKCALPGCGEPLYITWHASRAVYLVDRAEDLAGPAGAHTRSWRIECGGGHVILLPPDTAEDYYDFGPDDLARLRAVTLPAEEESNA